MKDQYTVFEKDGKVTITVVRIDGSNGIVYGYWRPEVGTATTNDYTPPASQEGLLVINDGMTSQSFEIPILTDQVRYYYYHSEIRY